MKMLKEEDLKELVKAAFDAGARSHSQVMNAIPSKHAGRRFKKLSELRIKELTRIMATVDTLAAK